MPDRRTPSATRLFAVRRNWHVGTRPTRDYVRDRVLLGPEGRYRIHVQGAERRDE
jgi:hypothetical protein